MRSRRLVAEALDILRGLPHAGTMSEPTVAARRVAALSPGQLQLSDRVRIALTGWGAVVLAAPVGSGKTWIALHAAAQRDGAVAVIGPATLRRQWLDTAARLSIDITYTSLERVSVGHLPPPHARIVLVDEAHRLRNPGTRRVAHVTPWLIGREVIFITGTPIVNGPRDLTRLLRLCLADDCLRLDGVPSLDRLADCATPPRALERLVVGGAPPGSAVSVVRRTIPPNPSEELRGERVVRILDRLALGESPAIRRLVRVVLLDAAASSDAAWHGALRRYRTLLRHAQSAGCLSRQAIRSFVGACPEQGVMWELVRTTDRPSHLPLDDLTVLDEVLTSQADDAAWIGTMKDTLAGMGPALVFTRHLGTHRVVREAMGTNTAWVSGEAAGIGAHRLPRRAVLSAFGPERDGWRVRRAVPSVLVLSDVGAEGLDLQGAECVVHLDVPWHDTGIRQRTGRAARIGQQSPRVVEILRMPPTAIDEALGTMRIVRRKARRSIRWMRALGRSGRARTSRPETKALSFQAILVVTLECGARRGVIALGREREAGEWVPVDLGLVETLRRRRELIEAISTCPPRREFVDAVRRCTSPELVSRPPLVARIMAVAVEAAQRRQVERVAAVDRLIRAASRRHGAGLEQEMGSASIDQLLACPSLIDGEAADRILEVIHLIPAVPRPD